MVQVTSNRDISDQGWAAHEACQELCLVVCDACLLLDLEVFLLDWSNDWHLQTHLSSSL